MEALVLKAVRLGERMNAARSESSVKASQHLRPEVVEVLRLLVGWPDEDIVNAIIYGSQIVGDIAPTKVFREADVPAAISSRELCQDNDEWATKLTKNRPPDIDERIAHEMTSAMINNCGSMKRMLLICTVPKSP